MNDTICFYSGKSFKPHDTNEHRYTKTFDFDDDKNYIERCAYELLVRTFMKKNNFEVTTKTLSVYPEHLQEKLNTYDPSEIQMEFTRLVDEIKYYITDTIIARNDRVEINIERAEPVSVSRLHEIAESDELRKKFAKRLFEILSICHRSNIIHRDIKLENLVYVRRNGEDVIVLNDWDASFILQSDTDGTNAFLNMATPLYASPEQVNGEKIGKKTDIWQAGMVLYFLYNNLEFPEQYACIDRDDKTDILNSVRILLNGMAEYKKTFTPPKNGDDHMKKIIMATLRISSRPTADYIFRAIDSQQDTLPMYQPSLSPDMCRNIMEEQNKPNGIFKKIGLIAVVAVTVLTVNFVNKKPEIQENIQTVAETVTTKPITEPETEPATEYITEYITEHQDTAVNAVQYAESLDYSYVKWVEDYKLTNGIYTGGLNADNQLQGHNCKFINNNGDVYEGDFCRGRMSGKGTYIYSNGNIYVGEINNDMREGHGTYRLVTSINGYEGVYEGEFKNNVFEGNGTFTFSDNRIFSGTFKEDILWNGTAIYPNGLVKTINNGKPIED